MIKRVFLGLVFYIAVANAGAVYTFTGNTGPSLGSLQMTFQYSAPNLLTRGEFLLVLQSDLNYSSPGGSVGFAEETPVGGAFVGQTFSSLNVYDASSSTLYPFTFIQGAFTAFGAYPVLDDTAAPTYPGMTGTLTVADAPEPLTSGVCAVGLVLLALLRLLRIRCFGGLRCSPGVCAYPLVFRRRTAPSLQP